MSNDYWLGQATEAAAQLDLARVRTQELEEAIEEIKKMTLNHDLIRSTNGNVYASVSPKKLGDVLAKLDPEWVFTGKKI
jgi:ribosomal protein L22